MEAWKQQRVANEETPVVYLKDEEEALLVELCDFVARRGFPVSAWNLQNIVGRIAETSLGVVRLMFRLPAAKWVEEFIEMHNITTKSPVDSETQLTHLQKRGAKRCQNEENYRERLKVVKDVVRSLGSELTESEWNVYSAFLFSGRRVPDSSISRSIKSELQHLSTLKPVSNSQRDSVSPMETSRETASPCASSSSSSTPSVSPAPSTVVTPPTSSPSNHRNGNHEAGRSGSRNVTESVSSCGQTEESDTLFSDSVGKQVRDILEKRGRKKKNRLKIKILRFLDSIYSSDEEP